MKIHYSKIDDFVEQHDQLDWDGWTVIHDVPNQAAWMRPSGVQKGGTWYMRYRIEPNENGFYVFSKGLGRADGYSD